MRYILLHHHIFKNAGTSLDFALERQFGSRFATLHDDSSEGRISPAMLRGFIRERPELRAISSHHFLGRCYDAELQQDRIRCINLTLIRRPIDRLISVYRFLNRHDDDGAISRLARQESLGGFVHQLIKRHPNYVDSPQVTIFASNGLYFRRTSEQDLQNAIGKLADYGLCAPVDRFDEAMVTLEYYVSTAFGCGPLDLAYIPQNVSDTSSPAAGLHNQIKGEDRLWLARALGFDEKLYAFAGRELDRRIALVPNFLQRLAEFRARCVALTAAGEPLSTVSSMSDEKPSVRGRRHAAPRPHRPLIIQPAALAR